MNSNAEKVAHRRYNHGEYGSYDIGILRPTGKWKLVYTPVDDPRRTREQCTTMYVQHQTKIFGYNFMKVWVIDEDIFFAQPKESVVLECENQIPEGCS